jgi:hypothetical protein
MMQEAAPVEQPVPAFGDDDSGVTPEEQASYDDFVGKASDLIHGGETETVLPEILESLRGGGQSAPVDPTGDPETGAPNNGPILALANTAVQICQKLDVDSSEAGTPYADEVLYQGAVEVVEMLGEIAEAANIHTYSEDDLAGAFYQAVDLYRPIAIEMGRTTEETLKGQFGEIEEGGKDGRLDQVMAEAENNTEPPVRPDVEQ